MSNVGLTMFTSLMIILLAFFIMLSSMAVIDEKRKIEAMGSLVGAFGILPGGLSPSGENGGSFAPSSQPIDIIKKDMEHIRDILTKKIMSDKVQFLSGRTKDIIRINAEILFEPDSVELREDMKPTLLEVAEIVRNRDYPIHLEGHTDDQPPQTDEFKDNWEVSSLRAFAVLRFFLNEGQLNSQRLSAYGYAGYAPAAPNNSPANRLKNNRIDIVLDKKRIKNLQKLEKGLEREKEINFKGFMFRLFKEEEKK